MDLENIEEIMQQGEKYQDLPERNLFTYVFHF